MKEPDKLQISPLHRKAATEILASLDRGRIVLPKTQVLLHECQETQPADTFLANGAVPRCEFWLVLLCMSKTRATLYQSK